MNAMANSAYFDNYSPVGDFISIALCFVIIALIQSTYVARKRSFLIFSGMVLFIVIAAYADVLYHVFYLNHLHDDHTLIYLFRIIYHSSLFIVLAGYIVYIVEVQQLEVRKKKVAYILAAVGFLVTNVVDILGSIMGFGFVVRPSGNTREGFNIFILGYLYFVIIVMYYMFRYRSRLFSRVMTGFYSTMAVSFVMLAIQGIFNQSAFTTVTFVFPIIAMLYLIHASPYDISLGAVSVSSFENHIKYNYKTGKDFIIMSLYMRDFDDENSHFPAEIQALIREFSSTYFRGAVLFQLSNGHVVLVADTNKNPDFENKVNSLLNNFNKEYERFRLDYKIILGKAIDEISKRNEYVRFLRHIQHGMPENNVHFIEYDDVASFNKQKFILDELGDIYRRKDLNDPRVEVYCQPVLNIKTQKYDTAEALMRLNLPDIGMVFPDQFIPLAEENDFIHVLSLIILNKTCNMIRKLIVSGYEVKRISVNISVLELRDDDFCNDIGTVIKKSGIPDDKIAIEITESQNESDFLIMKSKINELKEHGITFYLDDFGTGYSNIERIMELPFDIIKFDRSLVIASGSDTKSEQMVGSLANMFNELQYSVLYEGVENDMDEKLCIDMSASYLQGYKYSRPVPIERLTDFFEKRDA